MGAASSEGATCPGEDCAPGESTAESTAATGEGAAPPSSSDVSDARAPPCTRGMRSAAPANEATIVRRSHWILLAEANGRERRLVTAIESNL